MTTNYKVKNILIITLLLIVIATSFNVIRSEYYRTEDMISDRSYTWFAIPKIIIEFIDYGDEEFVENRYLLSATILSGKVLENNNKESKNQDVINKYYSDLSDKVHSIFDNSDIEKRSKEIKELRLLLIETQEIYEEIYKQVSYNKGRNDLKFDPFKVNTKYLNRIFAEKIEGMKRD